MQLQLDPNDLVLVRHAPVATPGRLFGRTDAPARIPEDAALAAMRACLSVAETRVSSPALRCRQTATAIWGNDVEIDLRPELLEQSFGEWEDRAYADLPDIGTLDGEALAAHAPPGGESFNDVCARAQPTLRDLAARRPGPTVAVVHAGIIRACIALAIGAPAPALGFEVECLSITRFLLAGDGSLIVRNVNLRL